MTDSKDGRLIFVHKDFADSFEKEYQAAKEELARHNKTLSRLEFSKIFEEARQRKETTLLVQPIKKGPRQKKVSLGILEGVF